MGNAAPTGISRDVDVPGTIQAGMPSLSARKMLQRGRFLKSELCFAPDGAQVVVKVYARMHPPPEPDSVAEGAARAASARDRVSSLPLSVPASKAAQEAVLVASKNGGYALSARIPTLARPGGAGGTPAQAGLYARGRMPEHLAHGAIAEAAMRASADAAHAGATESAMRSALPLCAGLGSSAEGVGDGGEGWERGDLPVYLGVAGGWRSASGSVGTPDRRSTGASGAWSVVDGEATAGFATPSESEVEDAAVAETLRRSLVLRALVSRRRHPNLIPYLRAVEARSPHSTVLVARPFVFATVADRLSMRPFPLPVERTWMAYQTLRAVEQAHGLGVSHGDIKPENLLVTSWMWVYLSDWAFGKPATVPAARPADYYFFFAPGDSSRCCVAPERFIQPGEGDQAAPSQWAAAAADIFSVGCCLYELLGATHSPLLDLTSLLALRSGRQAAWDHVEHSLLAVPQRPFYEPQPASSSRSSHDRSPAPEKSSTSQQFSGPTSKQPLFSSSSPRDLVRHMLQLRVATRGSASSYLSAAVGEGRVFPAYFRDLLFPLGSSLHWHPLLASPDDRVRLLTALFPRLLAELGAARDSLAESVLAARLRLEAAHAAEAGGGEAKGAAIEGAVLHPEFAQKIGLPPPLQDAPGQGPWWLQAPPPPKGHAVQLLLHSPYTPWAPSDGKWDRGCKCMFIFFCGGGIIYFLVVNP